MQSHEADNVLTNRVALPDASTLMRNTSPYSRIAFPRDSGHLVREDINIVRAVVPDAAFPALFGYNIMSGREWNPKLSLLIRGKGFDFRSLFVLYDESGIRQRFRTRSIRPDWSRLGWAKRNHSFDPRSRSGLYLPRRETCSHDQEHQNDWEFSDCHYLNYSHQIGFGSKTITQIFGERTPLACSVWPLAKWYCRTPRKRHCLGRTRGCDPAVSASGRKQHAGRVRSPD